MVIVLIVGQACGMLGGLEVYFTYVCRMEACGVLTCVVCNIISENVTGSRAFVFGLLFPTGAGGGEYQHYCTR